MDGEKHILGPDGQPVRPDKRSRLLSQLRSSKGVWLAGTAIVASIAGVLTQLGTISEKWHALTAPPPRPAIKLTQVPDDRPSLKDQLQAIERSASETRAPATVLQITKTDSPSQEGWSWGVSYDLSESEHLIEVIGHSELLENAYKQRRAIVNAVPFRTFILKWPTLDLLLVNNTKATFLVDRLDIEVDKSLPDRQIQFVLTPLAGNEKGLLLYNEGWGTAVNVTINLHVGENERVRASAQRTIKSVDLGAFVDFSKDLGALKDGDSFWGDITYSEANSQRESQRKTVQFGPSAVGWPRVGGGGYMAADLTEDILLKRESDKPYTVTHRLAKSLAPNQSSRFQLRFAAPESSTHWFKVKVGFSDGTQYTSKPVKATLLLPRSAVATSLYQNKHPDIIGSFPIGELTDPH
jgi:hypothetical protein